MEDHILSMTVRNDWLDNFFSFSRKNFRNSVQLLIRCPAVVVKNLSRFWSTIVRDDVPGQSGSTISDLWG